jgi:hypothetical protein
VRLAEDRRSCSASSYLGGLRFKRTRASSLAVEEVYQEHISQRALTENVPDRSSACSGTRSKQ